MRRFRRLNQFYAFLFGYFWLVCPLCHEYFGGHETGKAVLFTSQHAGMLTCWKHDIKETKHV